MTNEEALKRMKWTKGRTGITSEEAEAIGYAIEKLSNSDEDCISRKAVLDALNKWDWQELYLPAHFKGMIDDLPSIQPTAVVDDCISRQVVLNHIYSVNGLEGFENSNVFEKHYADFIKSLPSVTPKPKTEWIPVSERLPEPHKSGKTFLVTDASGTIHFSKFYIPLSNSDITEPYWSGMIEVIAWMPLPEPYKAESEDKE